MACTYDVTNSNGEVISFNTKEEALKYAKDNNLAANPKKGDPSRTTETLANVLRQMAFGENNFNPQQLRLFQEELLDSFIAMEEQSQYFYKMGAPIALTKGLGKNFDQMLGVQKNLSELGIGMSDMEFEKAEIPFDVRYLLTGDSTYKAENASPYYHKITANNIRIMNRVNDLSRTMFMEQTPAFVDNSNKVIANLKSNLSIEKVREVKDDFTAFIQIAAYKKWIDINDKRTTTLRNSLIYDGGGETIVDIVKAASKLAPENMFLKFILPVNTVTKVGKKTVRNINNKDLINTIEGKTRGKLEPDVMASLMDSFTELYLNPRTQFHAKALFDYLIVKDGLMFKNKSFIKMIPTMMFEDMSKATDIASELLSLSTQEQYGRFLKKLAAQVIINKEGNTVPYFTAQEGQEYNALFRAGNVNAIKNKIYEKVFGYTYNQLYTRFEQIYATDVKYQYNLQYVRHKIKTPSGTRFAKGVTFSNENNVRQMKITMFTDAFSKTEKGSQARAKEFKETMEDLGEANVEAVKINDTDSNLLFKKFVRVRQQDGDYVTFKLVKVLREDSAGRQHEYTGEAMIAEGELVPRGVTGIYEVTDTVGAANNTGVADLGKRPTRELALEAIKAKAGDKGDNNPPPPAAPPANPVTPTPRTPAPTSGGISFREDTSTGYKERTIKNASADATIAIATDFNSAGEKLTKSTVEAQKKKYIPIDANNLNIIQDRIDKIVEALNSVEAKSLNIAGNGIYTMKGKYTQQQVDDFTYNLIKAVVESPNLKNKITSIRTGGQTGFDEAGAKAGMKLGIPTTILAPKGWKFRDVNGNDISDEKAFKARFGRDVPPPQAGLFEQTPPVKPNNPSDSNPITSEVISGGMFGGLALVAYDANDVDMSGMSLSPDEIGDTKKKIDNCK